MLNFTNENSLFVTTTYMPFRMKSFNMPTAFAENDAVQTEAYKPKIDLRLYYELTMLESR
jgi:hypothetical protein